MPFNEARLTLSLQTKLSPEDAKVADDAIAKGPWDLNGHQGNIQEIMGSFRSLFSTLERQEIVAAVRESKTCRLALSDTRTARCPYCGQELTDWEFNPATGFKAVHACECPSAVFDFVVDFPSGKVVVANDLRGLVKLVGSVGDVNTILGCKQTSEAYALAGLAHAFVGNTCPGVYRKAKDQLIIGSRRKKGKDRAAFAGARQVASICTDLWWYSLMDLEEFRKRAGREPGDDEEVISIKPGRYRFNHVYYRNRNDVGDAEVYTLVRRIGAAKDITDPYANLCYTVEEVVQETASHSYFQSFSADGPNGVVLRAIDHLMCCIGNGASYHPNGWWGFRPTIDRSKLAKEFKLPQLSGPIKWYPFCQYSVIYRVAHGHCAVHPSFIELTYQILCHMASGQGVYYAENDENAKKANIKLTSDARDLLQKLRATYPEYAHKQSPSVFRPKAKVSIRGVDEELFRSPCTGHPAIGVEGTVIEDPAVPVGKTAVLFPPGVPLMRDWTYDREITVYIQTDCLGVC